MEMTTIVGDCTEVGTNHCMKYSKKTQYTSDHEDMKVFLYYLDIRLVTLFWVVIVGWMLPVTKFMYNLPELYTRDCDCTYSVLMEIT